MPRSPVPADPGTRVAFAAVLALALASGCSSDDPGEPVTIGVFLSYTGYQSAHSFNSERALIMAIDAANDGGGAGGRRLSLLFRDTGSDPGVAMSRAQQLLDGGAALIIGPDTSDLAISARPVLADRTVIMPSFATSSDVLYRLPSWFVMGTPIGRMACELMAQVRADGRQNPLLIQNPTGYNSRLAATLGNSYGLVRFVLPTQEIPTASTLAAIVTSPADGFVLAALPGSASALVYALVASGELDDPGRWYLSPTLHSPVFLDSIPEGAMTDARGVAQGAVTSAGDFDQSFTARWQDAPLDDAYAFYDAGALAALALQRALVREGSIPEGTGLSPHVIAVTRPGGVPVHWNELAQGLERLGQGEEVTYQGLSGPLEFDVQGLTGGALTTWWTIGPEGFADREATSACP
jgi:ABC-type branched-subunit amino acid transport system substrate-binding protein